MKVLHRSARVRATRRGRAFEIGAADLSEMLERQRYRCAVTGLKFIEARRDGQYWRHPYAPSLDRINSAGGYVLGNVRLVVAAANIAMGEWGEAVFYRIAEAALAHRLTHRPTDTFRDT